MGFYRRRWLAAVLLLLACRREAAEKRQAPAASALTSASGAPRAPSSSKASPASPRPTSEPAIRDLLARWLDAQNRADFAAYEPLYARKFVGIKRVGAQSFRFDRVRWLLDRKGMLSHSPKVAAANITVVDLSETAVVRFEQTFESGKFRDVGQKQLTIIHEGDKFVIGREEMLTSFQTLPRGVLAFPELALVEPHGPRSFVLLERSNLPPAQPELVDFELAVAPIADEAALPENRRGLAGRELALYGENGEACRVKVRRLVLAARAVPHDGQAEAWRGEGEVPAPALPKAAIAHEVFELAGLDGRNLALELEPNPRCKSAFFARAADEPALESFQHRAVTPAEQKAALAAFQALPLYAKNQKAFEQTGGHGPWTNSDGAEPVLDVFSGRSGTWLSVSSQVGHGCAEYNAQGFALFRVHPGGKLELATDGANSYWFLARAAVDANGDGVPEFIGLDMRVLQRLSGVFGLALDLAAPVFACGC